jgi:hypothetical protein
MRCSIRIWKAMAEGLRTGTLRFSTLTFNKARMYTRSPQHFGTHTEWQSVVVTALLSLLPQHIAEENFNIPCLVSPSDSVVLILKYINGGFSYFMTRHNDFLCCQEVHT